MIRGSTVRMRAPDGSAVKVKARSSGFIEDIIEAVLSLVIELAVRILYALWLFRLQVILITGTTYAYLWLHERLVSPYPIVVLALPVLAVLAIRPLRNLFASAWLRARMRRQWNLAVVDVGLADPPARRSMRAWARTGPIVLQVDWRAIILRRRFRRAIIRTPSGMVLRVKIPRSQSIEKLDEHAKLLKTALHAIDVRVMADAHDGAVAWVTVTRKDLFDRAHPFVWPRSAVKPLSLWDPIDLGIDEDGAPVRLSLFGQNILIGGIPEAGKSAALNLFASHAALDPHAKLWLIDAKRVGFSVWSKSAQAMAVKTDEANAVLARLQAQMDERYTRLDATGEDKISRAMGYDLHVLLIDELAFYTVDEENNDLRGEFIRRLGDIVRRGRAAGIITIIATHKSGAEVFPTAIRDLFSYRLAFKCGSPQHSDTILGQGMVTAGYNAAKIPNSKRGVGYLLSETTEATKLRTYLLGREQVKQIAQRGADLRTKPDMTVEVEIEEPSDNAIDPTPIETVDTDRSRTP
jgi:hypothetical protein